MTDLDASRNADKRGQAVRLSDMVGPTEDASPAAPLSSLTYVKTIFLGVLLVGLHSWQLPQIVARWRHDVNWQHGFLIPLFSLYLIFARRHELMAAPRRTCLGGLPILLFGIFAQILAYWPGSNNWLMSLNLTIILFGVVLYLAGPQVAKLTWLPIFFLAFGIPLPARLYTAIALPLQEFAAFVSAVLLKLAGVEIDISASTLMIVSWSGQAMPLTVAEACSGIRSLMAFVAVGVAIAYLENRPAWQRVLLVVSTIPIAILCNVIRVTITCTMYVIDQPQLGQKFMHEFLGLVMLVPAFLMLWALGWVLRKLSAEHEDDEEAPEEAATA